MLFRSMLIATSLVFPFLAQAACYSNLDDAAIAALKTKGQQAAQNYGQAGWQFEIGPADSNSAAALQQFITDQINHDSAMRNQIADEVRWMEQNGHDVNERGPIYFDLTGNGCSDLIFDAKRITVTATNAPAHVNNYVTTVVATDGFHGGFMIEKYRFTLSTSIKNGMLELASYPLFLSKEEIDCDMPFTASTPAECKSFR